MIGHSCVKNSWKILILPLWAVKSGPHRSDGEPGEDVGERPVRRGDTVAGTSPACTRHAASFRGSCMALQASASEVPLGVSQAGEEEIAAGCLGVRV